MRIGKYESSDGTVGTAVTFLLIGLGIGAAVGLLLAPKTGRQLRKDLRRSCDDALGTVSDWTDEAKNRFEKGAGQGRAAKRFAAPLVGYSRFALRLSLIANSDQRTTNSDRPSALRFGPSFVLERALLLVHIAENKAHREPEVVLLLFAETRKRGAGLQVIGLESHCETPTDLAVEAGARHYRPASADFRDERSRLRGRHAACALVPVQQFGKRRPASILAAEQLHAEKKVVLSRRPFEGGIRGGFVELTRWKGGRQETRDL